MDFTDRANSFLDNLPYLNGEYARRNWGHPWHSMCSYHGKLKPSIAKFLVESFSSPGYIVLDPLAGIGTIPLEARIQGRIGYGNDHSPLAAIVTQAKLEVTARHKPHELLSNLRASLPEMLSVDPLCDFEDFGLNKRISDYFHPNTLREILALRSRFLNKHKLSPEEAIVFASFAHVLHGNRPYALSRKSHPLTPYAPSGDFQYKNVLDHIEVKLTRLLERTEILGAAAGESYNGDYRELLKFPIAGKVDTIITSPPFVGSLRFNSQNWMRLWLAGWTKERFERSKPSALEQASKDTYDAYTELIGFCYRMLRDGGELVLHVGKNSVCDMGRMLHEIGTQEFSDVIYGSEDVRLLEKHGVRDKGGTSMHQFVFMRKSI